MEITRATPSDIPALRELPALPSEHGFCVSPMIPLRLSLREPCILLGPQEGSK